MNIYNNDSDGDKDKHISQHWGDDQMSYMCRLLRTLYLVRSDFLMLAIITWFGQLTPLSTAVKSSKKEVKSVFIEEESASGKDGRRIGLEEFKDQHARFFILRRRAQVWLILS